MIHKLQLNFWYFNLSISLLSFRKLIDLSLWGSDAGRFPHSQRNTIQHVQHIKFK